MNKLAVTVQHQLAIALSHGWRAGHQAVPGRFMVPACSRLTVVPSWRTCETNSAPSSSRYLQRWHLRNPGTATGGLTMAELQPLAKHGRNSPGDHFTTRPSWIRWVSHYVPLSFFSFQGHQDLGEGNLASTVGSIDGELF
eukprot:Skav235981  [mRNA]  locus=scaffold592:280364:280783:+ [translate_table: standard]